MLNRAVAEWNAGRPYGAWQVLADAGMSDQWVTFQREAFTSARRTFTLRMSQYT